MYGAFRLTRGGFVYPQAAMTEKLDEEIDKYAMREGADDYMNKPLHLSHLSPSIPEGVTSKGSAPSQLSGGGGGSWETGG